LANGDSPYGSSKQLKIKVFSKLLLVSKEAAATLSERSNYSPWTYSKKNMLSCKA